MQLLLVPYRRAIKSGASFCKNLVKYGPCMDGLWYQLCLLFMDDFSFSPKKCYSLSMNAFEL